MRESKVEGHLRAEVKKRGGRCLKFVSPGRRGVTDRIVQWPARLRDRHPARTHYVETKAPGKKPKPHQEREHKWLRANGFEVFVLDTREKVNDYIRRHA